MNHVLFQVGNLCSCKENSINEDFYRMGIKSIANVQEGLIHVIYEQQLCFFVEIIEVIEHHGCSVIKTIHQKKSMNQSELLLIH